MQLPVTPEITGLVELYQVRYETLLTVIRFTTLILSALFIWLSLTGRSNYPRWIAIFNPILLIIASFIIYVIAPGLGKHLMPIALNVAFLSSFHFHLSMHVSATITENNYVSFETNKIDIVLSGSHHPCIGRRAILAYRQR
jgi:hypothetical protein